MVQKGSAGYQRLDVGFGYFSVGKVVRYMGVDLANGTCVATQQDLISLLPHSTGSN
jgi:hypothetical protein